ncbi:hypothetical protein AXG93_4134s1070 [Marchantia polymorpha subsp. ruderalis]|uniref:Peptidase A1 domain-containing protein n=1 Tax=Marchantia polymorpha subsp. ruderalis TaxID=1480154 RepID=A0A176VHF0_MARPO|nr:hypothetical protein AXG93_4134s1070 [Marchantia polymorpha subsp. ruderalis]
MASSLVLCLVSLLMVTISTTTCTPQELNRDANSDPTDRPSGSPGRPETAEMSGGPWRSIQAELGDISFPSQLGASFGNIFSYCLVPAKGVATQTSPLLFGSAALSNATGIQYTPILYNTSLYFVGLQAISVAGQPLGIPSSVFANNGTDGGTIFDSGTTYTQLQPQALDALGTALGGKMPFTQIPSTINGFDYCWDASGLTDADIAKHVPTVSFNFTGANYDLSFDNTFLTGGDALFRTICLAISRGVLVSESIIGNYQQRNVYVVYDRANSQIGFVPRNCGEAVSVSPSTTTGTSSASSSASAGTSGILSCDLEQLSFGSPS